MSKFVVVKKILWALVLIGLLSCVNNTKKEEDLDFTEVEITYAEGFSIHRYEDFTKVIVHSPWQEAEKELVYILKNKEIKLPNSLVYDAMIDLPIEKLVTTSTTHIPSLIALNKLKKLVGFPNLDYISSEAAREYIAEGKIKELGKNEAINTEIVLELDPDVIFSFALEGQNKALNKLQESGIPIVYNGDWLEKSALGKAEWVKFFGIFLGELDQSIKAFEDVEQSYQSLKDLAKTSSKKPSVIAGAMHQDRWYLPYGTSWQAQFFEDAHADYIYNHTKGKGSAAFAFETVLQDAKQAEFWISPGQYISYEQLRESNTHYQEFDAFQQKNIFTMARTTGETGGVLFYELGPNRPDLILKDLVKIFHPDLLTNEAFTFFKPIAFE